MKVTLAFLLLSLGLFPSALAYKDINKDLNTFFDTCISNFLKNSTSIENSPPLKGFLERFKAQVVALPAEQIKAIVTLLQNIRKDC